MIECLTRDVIALLMERDGLTMTEAMDKFYCSQTYNSLSNPETGLYFQSPVYIFDELKNEA